MRGSVLCLTIGCGLLFAAPALAGDVKVLQKNFAFSQSDVRVKTGDTITFVNEDPVPHNVYSLSKGLEFEIRSQMPGKADPVPFQRPGTAEVRCAIHPKMKLTVHVGQ
jgi:plastocyanin